MCENSKFKVLFIGDIVGRPGRRIVEQYLSSNRDKYDFVIANVENASHGFGLTLKNHDELALFGVDAMTSGNHIWDKKDNSALRSILNEIDMSSFSDAESLGEEEQAKREEVLKDMRRDDYDLHESIKLLVDSQGTNN